MLASRIVECKMFKKSELVTIFVTKFDLLDVYLLDVCSKEEHTELDKQELRSGLVVLLNNCGAMA